VPRLLHMTLLNSINFLHHIRISRNNLNMYRVFNVITDTWRCFNYTCFTEGPISKHDYFRGITPICIIVK
jgi:hypothetical protein